MKLLGAHNIQHPRSVLQVSNAKDQLEHEIRFMMIGVTAMDLPSYKHTNQFIGHQAYFST
jgi:hypothetical protein